MKPTFMEILGNTLRAKRLALGVSQKAFADQIKMHRTYYSAIERGEKNLQLITLSRVCAGLKVPLWEVVREAETKNQK